MNKSRIQVEGSNKKPLKMNSYKTEKDYHNKFQIIQHNCSANNRENRLVKLMSYKFVVQKNVEFKYKAIYNYIHLKNSSLIKMKDHYPETHPSYGIHVFVEEINFHRSPRSDQ